MTGKWYSDRPYTIGEEIANSVTHGIGVGLAVAALSILVVYAAQMGDPWRVVSFAVYGATLILLYLASTLYHSFQNPQVKHVFNIIDHSAIFLLIAGTYTPFTLVTLRGGWGWTLFGLIWGMAFSGIVFKMLAVKKLRIVSVFFYVAMGWLVVIAIGPLMRAMPPGGMFWLALGGLCYSGGVAFYLWRKLPFGHMIWHLFVLAGSISHFFCIFWYVLPAV